MHDSFYVMPSKVHSHVCVRCIGGCCLDEIAEHMLSTHLFCCLHILYSWTNNIIYSSELVLGRTQSMYVQLRSSVWCLAIFALSVYPHLFIAHCCATGISCVSLAGMPWMHYLFFVYFVFLEGILWSHANLLQPVIILRLSLCPIQGIIV